MNLDSFTFEIFFVPHSRKWSVLVKQKGVRLSVPFLVECAETMEELLGKIDYYVKQTAFYDDLPVAFNDYENKHRSDAG